MALPPNIPPTPYWWLPKGDLPLFKPENPWTYKEWRNQFSLRGRTVKQIEHASKNPVTAQGRFVQFVPRRTVVAVVGKLARVQVNAVRPVLLLSSGKKRDKLLVLPFACQPEAAHISAAGQKP